MKRFVLTIAILTINNSCVAMDKNGKTTSMVTCCLRNRTTLLFSLTGVASFLALYTVTWCTTSQDKVYKTIANTNLEKNVQTDNDNKPIAHSYPQQNDYDQSQGYDDHTIRQLEQQRDPRFYGRDGR